MRPESRALAQELLNHHWIKIAQIPPGKHPIIRQYTIRYGDLCGRAGVPHLTRRVGSFLQEVAVWCQSKKYPPLNALAVNDTEMPGDGYDGAGDCKIVDWPRQATDCIQFVGYPAVVP